MLKEIGCTWVILGHSERRILFHEDDEVTVENIFRSHETLPVVERQVKAYQSRREIRFSSIDKISPNRYERVVFAYEPVWAIGTGKVATPQQAQEVHEHLRKFIEKTTNADIAKRIRLIYGGTIVSE